MWGRYLIEEIENAEPGHNEVIAWFLGGAGIAVRSSESLIYVDPYFGGSPSREWLRMIAVPVDVTDIKVATAILSTHEHTDHCHRETIVPVLAQTGAKFIGPASSAGRVRAWLASEKIKGNVIEVQPGDSLKVSTDMLLRVFEARDLYSEHAVTYLLETPGGSIFHSGDSSYFPGLKDIGDHYVVDLAFLCIGRNLRGRDDYMTPCDAVRAAIDLNAKVIVPLHFDMWKKTREDPKLVETIARAWETNVSVIHLSLGDSLKLTRGVAQKSLF
ncbi:MAG: MBL fold metallo-hydrolase [Thermofilaceae archaeon]